MNNKNFGVLGGDNMECCSKCFKKVCRCKRHKIEVDYYIYPAIYELNRKGYETATCCSGHVENGHLSTYIKFKEELDVVINSEYFEYESYNYRGFHERRDSIRLKQEVKNKFKKKRTNKLELLQVVNKDLYRWAKSLPSKLKSQDKVIEFPEDYFEQEVENEEVVDVQNPWLLFTERSKDNGSTLDDFFEEIGCEEELTEIIVNRSGRFKRFDDNDYTQNSNRHNQGRANFLKDKIEFDISGDYKYFLCGYEPYMMIEKILVENTTWYLTYARTDLATRYEADDVFLISDKYIDDDIDDFDDEDYDNDIEGYANPNVKQQMEPLIDEYDTGDYFDEHENVHDVDLFTHLFNRMCRMGINICVFSADNVNIVFTNKTDFHVLMADGQSIIAFGEAAYEDIEFSRVSVAGKELIAYVNGRILLRKEIE